MHDNHIDVNIEFDKFPFEVQLGEELLCAVKWKKNFGLKANGIVELFITKKEGK